ncbi:MAG: hypothetical protein IJ565_04660 [Bacilli bacterium]|nr:hypothetical protein [Bacilli bacterium]
MIISIYSTLEKWSSSLKEFMLSHQDHSIILYTGLFILGLIIFASVYSTLHKDQ